MLLVCEGVTYEYSTWWNESGTVKVTIYHVHRPGVWPEIGDEIRLEDL